MSVLSLFLSGQVLIEDSSSIRSSVAFSGVSFYLFFRASGNTLQSTLLLCGLRSTRGIPKENT